MASPARTSALPPKTQNSSALALARLASIKSSRPGIKSSATRLVGMNDRRGLRCSFLRACGLALLPGATHNTYCAFVPLVPRFTPLFLIAPTLLTREPLRCGNKGSHYMALCDAPLLRCHADCFPDSPSGTRLPSSRGNQRASLQASFAPTQPLRRKGTAGSACPKAPAHPQCSSPSIPKETAREIDWLASLVSWGKRFFCVGSFVFRSGFF